MEGAALRRRSWSFADNCVPKLELGHERTSAMGQNGR